MKRKHNHSVTHMSGKCPALLRKSGITLIALLFSFASFATVPAPITGPVKVCVGQSITLNDATSGGTWSSSSPATAYVGVTSGIVTGAYPGTVTIHYNTSGGSESYVITVNPLGIITPIGLPTVCQGQSIILANSTAGGGAWSSGSPSVATIGLSTASNASVTGASAGTSVITYTTPAGCVTTRTVAVNATAPVTGPSSVCQGQSIQMNDAVAGGTWSSTVPANANVGLTSGLVTGGSSSGLVYIKYTLPTGCVTSASVTVNPLAPILPTGTPHICQSDSILLHDAVGGGTWTSSTPSIATVGTLLSSAVAGGVSAGTDVISYTTIQGCITTRTVLVTPTAPITGPSSVCVGQSVQLSDGVAGGTWSSAIPSYAFVGLNTGLVTGGGAGFLYIKYILPSGCISTASMTVNPLAPILPFTSTVVCQTDSIILYDYVAGGTWTSSNVSVATITTLASTIAVVGASAGTTVISYTTAAGCITTKSVTVNPTAPITGPSSVCVGQSVQLSDAIAGGTWSSTVPSYAFVGLNTGLVTGSHPGLTYIKYTLPTGCISTASMTVNPLGAILSNVGSAICQGDSITLYDYVSGGTWSSGTPSVATINVMTLTVSIFGVSAGTSVISYTTTAGCIATRTVTVSTTAPITGPSTVCQGQSIQLSNTIAGGTWSSTVPGDAFVGLTTGLVTGSYPGLATIKYTLPGQCITTATVMVNALQPITPFVASVCVGRLLVILDQVTEGGTWSNSTPSVGTITATTPYSIDLAGLTPGTTVITFTTAEGCIATRTVTVINCDTVVTTGVNTVQNAPGDITIFPNPGKGTFTVNGKLGTQTSDQEVFIDITDITGQIIHKRTATARGGEINEQVALSSTLPNGIYILRLKWSDEQKVFRIAVQQ